MASRLRPATPQDSEFCFEVHKRALGALIVEVFGRWKEQEQKGFHARWFDPDRVQIIESDDGLPIGVFDVSEESDHAYLSRIELLPEHRGRGVGSELIRSLQARGRPVRLHVFALNTRARALYERLGFSIESEANGRVAMIA